jgi:hypothetical protein
MDCPEGEDAQAGEARMHDDNAPPGKMRRSSGSYRVVARGAWGLLLRAVTRVAPAGSRIGSLMRCLGALARLFFLRTLATLRIPLCCAALLLRH